MQELKEKWVEELLVGFVLYFKLAGLGGALFFRSYFLIALLNSDIRIRISARHQLPKKVADLLTQAPVHVVAELVNNVRKMLHNLLLAHMQKRVSNDLQALNSFLDRLLKFKQILYDRQSVFFEEFLCHQREYFPARLKPSLVNLRN